MKQQSKIPVIYWMCVLMFVAIKRSSEHDDIVKHAVFIREINDPCLPSNHENISHLGNRYVNLRETCEYTDSRIKNAWFYAGLDNIASYPHVPEMCSCGYKFPIWMNGTMPNVEEGVVSRTTCMRFGLNSCDQKIEIQIKNCNSFFVYRLSAPPDDAGFCFGLDEPVNPASSTSLHTSPIGASNTRFSTQTTSTTTTCSEGSLASGTARGSTSSTSSTSMTTASTISAFGRLFVSKNSITNHSFDATVEYISGGSNATAEVILRNVDGAIIQAYVITSAVSQLSFSGLRQGTKYMLSITANHRNATLFQTVVITQPCVHAYLAYDSANTAYRYTAFKCLQNLSSNKLLYVRWFMDNISIEKTGYPNEDGNILDLSESDLLMKHVYLPFNISCTVGDEEDTMSVKSQTLFAGIEVKTASLTMFRNETKAIRISPTIPFGCYRSQSDVPNCNISIIISIPIRRECMGISTRKCRISISGEVGKESEIQIQSTEDGQYGVLQDVVFDVILRTSTQENTIWNNYFLPTIKVTVLPERMTYWRGKRCEALNDPHMFTFDTKQYEHHESLADEYVLYSHNEFNVKIHHRLERCNSNAMCNCGVAVQAGKDIYIISTCNSILEIGYRKCDDNVLLVKQESDAMYTIYLPFGTYVKARLDKTPYADSVRKMIVSVSVYPSVHDQNGRSSGLCGTLDNNAANDFHGRNGEHLTNKTDFIYAWRVSKSESLFNPNMRSTESWTFPACSCSVRNGEVLEEDVCTLGADNSCSKGRKVGEQTCLLAKKSPLSGGVTTSGQNIPTFDLTNNGNHNTLPPSTATVSSTLMTPRSTITGTSQSNNTPPVAPPETWTYVTALKTCQQYMDASKAFQLCTLIPYTDTTRSVQTCALDIVLSQTTQWQKLSRQSMQDSCVAEINRNTTVRQDLERNQITSTTLHHIYSTTSKIFSTISNVTGRIPTTTQSPMKLTVSEIIEAIKEIACPNECSDQGQCTNGTCICNREFGGDDCSIDFSKPPSAASLVYSNLCDEKVAPCSSVYIHGGFFASDSVSCHVTSYETQVGKEGRQNLDAFVARGITQSLIEVICPLLPTRRVRSVSDQGVKLISCYKVSVSNDGVHHGNPLEMCVYNSECQLLRNTSQGLLTATIKNGFCFIDGECFQRGENSHGNFCIPEINLYGWAYTLSTGSVSTSFTSVSQTPFIPMTPVNSAPSWQTLVIVAVTCICVVCLVVTLVIYMRIRRHRMTENSSKESKELEVKYKHDPDFDEEAYAHINPVDVNDQFDYKTSKSSESNELAFVGLNGVRFEKSARRLIQMDDINHYTGLDMKTRENAHYDKLKDAARQNEQPPELPDRSAGYEKLNAPRQRAPDYDQLKARNSQFSKYTGLDKVTRDKALYENLKIHKEQEKRSKEIHDGSARYEET